VEGGGGRKRQGRGGGGGGVLGRGVQPPGEGQRERRKRYAERTGKNQHGVERPAMSIIQGVARKRLEVAKRGAVTGYEYSAIKGHNFNKKS